MQQCDYTETHNFKETYANSLDIFYRIYRKDWELWN